MDGLALYLFTACSCRRRPVGGGRLKNAHFKIFVGNFVGNCVEIARKSTESFDKASDKASDKGLTTWF